MDIDELQVPFAAQNGKTTSFLASHAPCRCAIKVRELSEASAILGGEVCRVCRCCWCWGGNGHGGRGDGNGQEGDLRAELHGDDEKLSERREGAATTVAQWNRKTKW